MRNKREKGKVARGGEVSRENVKGPLAPFFIRRVDRR